LAVGATGATVGLAAMIVTSAGVSVATGLLSVVSQADAVRINRKGKRIYSHRRTSLPGRVPQTADEGFMSSPI